MQTRKMTRYPACLVIFALVSGPTDLTRAEVYYEDVPVLDVAPIVESRRIPVLARICDEQSPEHRPSGAKWTDLRAGRPWISIADAVREDRKLWHARYGSEPLCRTQERYEWREIVVGYRVEYVYGSELFVTRMDHDPGERLRVRVELEATGATESGFHHTLRSSRRPRYRQ